jgi:hypothetical protein
MGNIYKLDKRITSLEQRLKSFENKLNEVLEYIKTR